MNSNCLLSAVNHSCARFDVTLQMHFSRFMDFWKYPAHIPSGLKVYLAESSLKLHVVNLQRTRSAHFV